MNVVRNSFNSPQTETNSIIIIFLDIYEKAMEMECGKDTITHVICIIFTNGKAGKSFLSAGQKQI